MSTSKSRDGLKSLMKASSTKGASGKSEVKKVKIGNVASITQGVKVATGKGWKSGLKHTLNDPESLVFSTKSLTVIKDKYPKAKFHYLMLPTLTDLNSPRELDKTHLNLLKEMNSTAQELIQRLHSNVQFNIGFHAKPSMDHLHLHMISKDFISPCLKTKRHWNSFNTPHFLNLSDLINKLEDKGKIVDYPTNADIESYLKSELRCNQCPFEAKTMPQLKSHLDNHATNK